MQLKESARAGDKHVTDKGAYRVSSIMGQGGMNLFGQQRVTEVAACLVSGSFGTTDKGSMDAMANHLKCDGFRSAVWKVNGVKEMILSVPPTSASALVYKSIVCIWMLSFNPQNQPELAKTGAAQNLRDVFATSRDLHRPFRAAKLLEARGAQWRDR